MQCNSYYPLSEKEDSEEISSDGEFNDASRLDVFDEDDSYILTLEKKKFL